MCACREAVQHNRKLIFQVQLVFIVGTGSVFIIYGGFIVRAVGVFGNLYNVLRFGGGCLHARDVSYEGASPK